MGFISWICKLLCSNKSTCIRIMDLGVEDETLAWLGDEMTSHGHMCYQGWQDNTLTLASKTDKLIIVFICGSSIYSS
jgi:hypothetical protein